MRALLIFFTELLMRWCERTGRVFKITGTAEPDDVYLIRYYVIRSNYFNFFIHQFLRSDRDDLHDHPWDFMTYLVRGEYTERKYNPKMKQIETILRANHDFGSYGDVKQNTLVFRRAIDQHQVVVDTDLKLEQKDQAALTLFFSGPTKREWGFVREEPLSGTEALAARIEGDMYQVTPKMTKRVWVPWKKYLGLPEDAPSRG